jgi:Cu+-exporting ATPase
MTNAIAVKDHVCGMDVETATAPGKSDYKGKTYYFCGAACKTKFDLKPEQYLGDGAPKSGCGCCKKN